MIDDPDIYPNLIDSTTDCSDMFSEDSTVVTDVLLQLEGHSGIKCVLSLSM